MDTNAYWVNWDEQGRHASMSLPNVKEAMLTILPMAWYLFRRHYIGHLAYTP